MVMCMVTCGNTFRKSPRENQKPKSTNRNKFKCSLLHSDVVTLLHSQIQQYGWQCSQQRGSVGLQEAIFRFLNKANIFVGNVFMRTQRVSVILCGSAVGFVQVNDAWFGTKQVSVITITAQKMKFSITNFFSKCDQIRRSIVVLYFCENLLIKIFKG